MTSTMPSRGGISRREQEVEVGQVHLETRIIKESTWQWRYKAYGDLGAVFCGMGKGLCVHLRARRRLSNIEVAL